MLALTTRLPRFRSLGGEFFWIVMGNVSATIAALASVRALSELLPPAGYGDLALGISVAALINQATLGPLGAGILRFYAPAVEQDSVGGYLRATRQLVLRFTATIAAALLVMACLLAVSGQTRGLATLAVGGLFALTSGYSSILSGIQNAARKRKIVALHQGAEPWLRLVFGVAAIALWGRSGAVVLAGYILAQCLVLASQLWFLKKTILASPGVGDTSKSRTLQRDIWSFTWPMSIFGIFTALQLASDRWALEAFSGTDKVGMYAVLVQLGYYPVATLTTMTLQFLAPIFFQRAGDANNVQRVAAVSRMSWLATVVALIGAASGFCLASLFHGGLFSTFVAQEYMAVSYLLPWMILAGGLFAAGQVIALDLMSRMQTRRMMGAKITTALFGAVLNVIGAYFYGLAGVTAAIVVFSASYLAWMACLSTSKDLRCA